MQHPIQNLVPSIALCLGLWLCTGTTALAAQVAPVEPAGQREPRPDTEPGAEPDPVEALWQRGERRQALDLMGEQLRARPEDQALRLSLARRLLNVHMFTAALEAATAVGPAGQDVAARALYFLGRYDEAVPRLAVLAEDGDVTDALMCIDALEALGRTAEAEAAADAAVQRHGDQHPALLSFLGRRAAARGDTAAALECFERALALQPLSPEALYGRGQALVRSGRREEGLAALQRHRELVPLMDQRDHALRAVDLEPSHASNHALLADAERALGRKELALERYATAQALATPAEWVPITLRHARALEEDFGRVDQAVALLDEADARQPDVRLTVRAGDLLLAAGRPAEAARRYTTALASRPGDANILRRLAAAEAAPVPAPAPPRQPRQP